MLLLCSVPRRTKRPPGSGGKSAGGKRWQPALRCCREPPLYYWEGKLEQEYEVQMLLKTDLAHQQALLDCLKSHHPYQTPELLVLPVTHGDNDYLSWLTASLR